MTCHNEQCFCDGRCEKTLEDMILKENASIGLPLCDPGWINGGINPTQYPGVCPLPPFITKPSITNKPSRPVTEKPITRDPFKYTDAELEQMDDRELEIRSACQQLADLLVRKNANYGDSFRRQYNKRGAVSSVIRIEDKITRLDNLIGGEQDKVGESIQDTFLDIAGYALLTYVEESR